MAAPTLQQVMEAIETQLQAIPGLRTAAYVADQVNPPTAIVGVPNIDEYHATFARGRMSLEFQVWILVSASLDRIGQMALASFADATGENSVINAIESDKTLGGTVNDCIVLSFRSLGSEEVGQIGYYGGVFELRVVADGS